MVSCQPKERARIGSFAVCRLIWSMSNSAHESTIQHARISLCRTTVSCTLTRVPTYAGKPMSRNEIAWLIYDACRTRPLPFPPGALLRIPGQLQYFLIK